MRRVKTIAAYVLSAVMLATTFIGVPANVAMAAEMATETDSIVSCDEATPMDANQYAQIAIDEVNFPDGNFRQYILNIVDKDEDGFLGYDEIENTTEISLVDAGVRNLTGISNFTKLRVLDCSMNSLRELNVKNNTELEYLNCAKNQLTTLYVAKNTRLANLYCSDNQLTFLNLSDNPSLSTLSCENNQISALNLSDKPELLVLNCRNNDLTSLDVSQNAKLNTLCCSSNQLTFLDLSNNELLKTLDCNNNETYVMSRTIDTTIWPGFDVAKIAYSMNGKAEGSNLIMDADKSRLSYGYRCGNWIVDFTLLLDPQIEINSENFPNEEFRKYISSEIDADKNKVLTHKEIKNTTKIKIYDKYFLDDLTGIEYFPNLNTLHCYNTHLTSLDISHNTLLEELICSNNYLKNLNVINNSNLIYLDCSENYLTDLDVSKNIALESLYCSKNKLTNLDVTNNIALIGLSCSENQLSELDISHNLELVGLMCDENDIEKLNLRGHGALTQIDCSNNQLKQLDVCDNEELFYLNCVNNYITELDVSNNHKLLSLSCECNDLWELDVTNNLDLSYFHCWYNELTYLDVSNNVKLTNLKCTNNQLTSIDISNNPSLINFDCSKNTYSVYSRSIDTTEFPHFDISKLVEVKSGGVLDGNIITMYDYADSVVYTYDCGAYKVDFMIRLAPKPVPGIVSLKSAVASNTDITVTWDVEPNAESYEIYRKKSNEMYWETIGTSETTSYIDKAAIGGVSYTYTVRAVNESGMSEEYDDVGVSATIKALPGEVKLNTPTVSDTDILISWKPVATASSYIVYRHAKGEAWTKIGVSTITNYMDRTAIGGINYAYTVKAVNENGMSKIYDKVGVITKITAKPGEVKLLQPTILPMGIQVNWAAVPTASSYIIYRHAKGEAWTKIGTSTTTMYVDEAVIGGKNYAYTVKAVNNNGVSISYDKVGIIAKTTTKPGEVILLEPTIGKTAIRVNWKETPTASSYVIYRHAKGESWTKIGTSTTTSYVDATAVGGKNYAYTVKAVNGNGSSTSYNTTGVIAKITALPGITTMVGATAYTGYINVQWKTTPTASSYNVYRKTADGKWTKIGTTTKTAYNDKTAVKGTTYYYTVIAVNGNGACKTYDTTGVKATAK